MLYTKFRGNRPAGSGKEDLKGFYHMWARRPSWSWDHHHGQIFISLHLKAFINNLVQIGKEVSEKIRFEFSVCTRPWAKVKK